MQVLMKRIALTIGLWAVASTVAGEFIPGHIYVTVRALCEGAPCDWIVQVNPDTGETTLLADSDVDGLWITTGLTFAPRTAEGTKLRVGNYHPAAGNVQEFSGDGSSTIVWDAADGIASPFGSNSLAYDLAGNLYVVNETTATILKFPSDGGPATVFADGGDGLSTWGSIAVAPDGHIFYCSGTSEEIIRFTPDGEAELFDIPPARPMTLAIDSNNNLFVGTNDYPMSIYRYDNADAATRRLLMSVPENVFWGRFIAMTLSNDETQIFLALPDLLDLAPGYIVSVDPDTGEYDTVAHFDAVPASFAPSYGIAVVPSLDDPCEGDANGDGAVDPLDAGFILARLGCPVGPDDPDCEAADQNNDGAVDPLDVGFVLARFGPCL